MNTNNDNILNDNIALVRICCPMPTCGKDLILSPPKSKRAGLRLGPERTGVICDECSGKFAYWGRLEIRPKPWFAKRKYCICLKIPNPTRDSDLNFLICCPICGNKLVLPSLKHLFTDFTCNTCAGKFSHLARRETHKESSPTGKRRLCLYMVIPGLKEQKRLWQYKVTTEECWVKRHE